MNEVKKCCVDCKTTKTPLWRTGPNGPRSLCNACGIRHRKRKMADDPQIKTDKPSSSSSSNSNSSSNSSSNPIEEEYDQQLRFSDLAKQTIVQRSSSSSQLKRQRRDNNNNSNKKLEEVEQAAVLLMSLSCGSVFA